MTNQADPNEFVMRGKCEDYVLLGTAAPGKYVRAVRIKTVHDQIPALNDQTPTHVEIYTVSFFDDGRMLTGDPSLSLTIAEFMTMCSASIEMLEKLAPDTRKKRP